MERTFHPRVTVAAIVKSDGRYLLVEEETSEGIRFNQPAGHLEEGESLIEGARRETLEETACEFTPEGLVGVYLVQAPAGQRRGAATYLRFAFAGSVGAPVAGRALDAGIRRALWMTLDEIRALAPLHRTPLVMRCIEDYESGRPLGALELVAAHGPLAALGVTP